MDQVKEYLIKFDDNMDGFLQFSEFKTMIDKLYPWQFILYVVL